MVRVLTSGEAPIVGELRRLAAEPATAAELTDARSAFEAVKRLRAEMGPIVARKLIAAQEERRQAATGFEPASSA